MNSNKPRRTDNRMKWAEKVLRQQVPECEMFLALRILKDRAKRHEGPQSLSYKAYIQPRLIANNWNK